MLQRILASAVVLVCLAGLSSAQCNDGWAEINGDCFGFVETQLLNWNESSYFCQELDGQLAKVASGNTARGLNLYILEYGLTGTFWLGGNDLDVEGDWVWESDMTRVERGIPFWALDSGLLGWSLEPQGGFPEDCMVMDENRFYYWDDRDCQELHHPLCMQG